MGLSTTAIDAMGFVPIPPDKPLDAVFHSLHVFEVRGLTVQGAKAVTTAASTAGIQYDIGLGDSINTLCSALAVVLYTTDEEAWAKEHKCKPPYVMIHFGPTQSHRVATGYMKNEGDELCTYDAFGAAQKELRSIEDAALASIEMALACAFASTAHTVRFVPVDRIAYGITPNNVTLHDLRFTMHVTADVSIAFDRTAIEAGLNKTAATAAVLNPRVSQFYQLGVRDQDYLKKFLYYFLAIEIEVHRAFRTISPAAHIANSATFEARVSTSLPRLLETRDNWAGLADRFVWCVVSVWKHLADADIQEFKRLKKIRDAIAHGDLAAPAPTDVVAVEKLVTRIHA
ncbi:MAG TPA: hypothetical protein PKH24_18935 [Sedimentisphaerales bacterium]|jgi:hypothetical protein|nr:hypothetical protein [Sedimentisphaerales bacterium]HNU31153.1 hypothetical protein [Sedimentisphaerales bacterium]